MKVAKQPARHAVPVKRPPRFTFFQEIISELKRVVWPTRQEATNLTIVVVVVSVAVGLFLGGVDMVFAWIVNRLVVGGP